MKVSRTIAREENSPQTPKLALSQTLTLTRGQFSLGAIIWLSPNPKTNPDLDPNPNPHRRAIFLEGKLSGYHLRLPYLLLHKSLGKITQDQEILSFENRQKLPPKVFYEKVYLENS